MPHRRGSNGGCSTVDHGRSAPIDGSSGLPRYLGELLEASYAADYVVIGGGAIVAATAGLDAVAYYWSLVLTSELACYVALPWLRSRPPRALGGATGSAARRRTAPLERRDSRSRECAGQHASRAGTWRAPWPRRSASCRSPRRRRWVLMVVAGLIAVAAVAGRYHYAVDCAAPAPPWRWSLWSLI